jgi:hypothetical protein
MQSGDRSDRRDVTMLIDALPDAGGSVRAGEL